MHGVDLAESANGIDQAFAGVRFDIMKDETHASGGTSNFHGEEYFLREAPPGPGQGYVLDQNPSVTPLCGHQLGRFKGVWPAVYFPKDATNFQLNPMGLESSCGVPAVFLNRIHRRVFAAGWRDAIHTQRQELQGSGNVTA